MNLQWIPAQGSDIPTLIDLQNRCFYSDYVKYGVCPGYGRSPQDMEHALTAGIVLRILADGEPVGMVSGRPLEGGAWYLSCMCVLPEYENRGIGQAAVNHLRSMAPQATFWSLVTPKDKLRNHAFYEKCGFRITGEEVKDGVALVVMETQNPSERCHGQIAP